MDSIQLLYLKILGLLVTIISSIKRGETENAVIGIRGPQRIEPLVPFPPDSFFVYPVGEDFHVTSEHHRFFPWFYEIIHRSFRVQGVVFDSQGGEVGGKVEDPNSLPVSGWKHGLQIRISIFIH